MITCTVHANPTSNKQCPSMYERFAHSLAPSFSEKYGMYVCTPTPRDLHHDPRVQVVVERVCSQHACNLYELVVVVVPKEERLALEDDGSHHAAQAPHVERVVIELVVDQQLWSLQE